MSDPRNTATGDWLARESLAFDRAFTRSRHNYSQDDGPGGPRAVQAKFGASSHDCLGLWIDGECNCNQADQEAA